MRENTDLVDVKKHSGGVKYPRLMETAEYYRIDIDTEHLHESEYDTWLTFEIFKRMLKNEKAKGRALNFLNKF
jgi:DNA polymerase-3 subunit epsilon